MVKGTAISFVAGLALTMMSSTAFAGWGDFEAAFPMFPCQDGWMGCLSGGTSTNPDLKKDNKGMPVVAGMRVGWHDLQPTESFSPFLALSSYTGELPEPEPLPDPDPVPSPDPVPTAEPEPDVVAVNNGGDGGSDPVVPSPDPVPAGGDFIKLNPQPDPEPSGGVEPTGLVRLDPTPVPDPEPVVEPDPVPDPAPIKGWDDNPPEPEPGGNDGTADVNNGNPPPPEPEPTGIIGITETPEPEVVDDSCDNLPKLEPKAMLGKLSTGQIQCLEGSLTSAPKQTTKDKISRVLMSNAYSKGDMRSWETLIKRHLDQIDQSDPDLCYKYALFLSKRGAGRANGAIRWADVALENKTVWTGDTYKNRVYSLYKMRAASAQKLWQKSETDFTKSPSEELQAKKEKARNRTKVFSREWYEYAKVAGKDTSVALRLCISAAGTKDYCEGG